ncbi:ATP-binding protein [Paenibacillus alvei]|uniref:ATP-binding protein n=1 Tax=Paenibacillus alvei TaxID=44250 RepID=UPI0022806B1A|nr:ATP-binding protein [Paenibacillus alvei]
MKKLLFVGGVHGVGKTHVCESISKKFNIPTYSASSLISSRKKEMFSKNKRVSDINHNQDLLIDALSQLGLEKNYYLLEGHFCLLNKVGEITRVPKETFFKLSPEVIIVLTDYVEAISHRLKNRDDTHYDLVFLDEFQHEEISYAKEIAELLKIPYYEYNCTVSKGLFEKQIGDYLNK